MRNLRFLAVLTVLLASCSSQLSRKQNTSQTPSITPSQELLEQPKLVVGIVVDQMRYDYLTRFYNRYGSDGFKRLMNKGFNATNNHYNFIPTYTAPGHASIYTGTTPADHGIIGNNWYDKFKEEYIYNTDDANVVSIGIDDDPEGKMSPRKLLASTVTDELELFTQGRAKVIGISIKDRGAILPAGHAADAAYWLRGGSKGMFISSSFYMNEAPLWVRNFNNSNPAAQYLKEWNTLYPVETYTASGPDLNNYEKAPKGKEQATFPYDLATLAAENNNYSLLKATPYGNSLVADFAIAAITNEQMGQDATPDFLAVSFSSTDYVGHQYGVNSVEIEDTYLRLDQDIARLLNHLDETVGDGNYTVFLTADHGAVNVPAYLKERRFNAGYFNMREFISELDTALTDKFGKDKLMKSVSNDQVFLNHKSIDSLNINTQEVEEFAAAFARNYPGIDKAFTRTALVSTSFADGMASLVQRGFHQQRSGDVVFVLDPAFIVYGDTGSTHGSLQSYDTHVPFLLYGYGVEPGSTADRTSITDVAPTISSILQISFPNSATGKPLTKALKKR